jgi:hypothetical protein
LIPLPLRETGSGRRIKGRGMMMVVVVVVVIIIIIIFMD